MQTHRTNLDGRKRSSGGGEDKAGGRRCNRNKIGVAEYDISEAGIEGVVYENRAFIRVV
ncbi:hypothetical protein [Rhizobium sp. H4]|uniref:hypothetical protein n=1 Tax=Rhizobium sp. H4 TaxID=2035449 RepID=UPI00131CECD7|nr:hypothetical protein [Rhizobium sp. H4]